MQVKKLLDAQSCDLLRVIGNGTVLLSWHSTLTKLTLPHDANSAVQYKKGTKPKTKEENPKHAQRGWGTIHAADYTAVFSCCLCVCAVASFCS